MMELNTACPRLMDAWWGTGAGDGNSLFARFMQALPHWPDPLPEEIDPLLLQNAGEGVLFNLFQEVMAYSEQYDVPGDVLWNVVVDWVVSDHMGWQRGPAEVYIPEERLPLQFRVPTNLVPQ